MRGRVPALFLLNPALDQLFLRLDLPAVRAGWDESVAFPKGYVADETYGIMPIGGAASAVWEWTIERSASAGQN